jgi:hypothetical protein
MIYAAKFKLATGLIVAATVLMGNGMTRRQAMAEDTPKPKETVEQPWFTFSTGGRYHFEGFGEWVVTLTDTGVMSVTHWARDTQKRYGPYTLNQRERADLKALLQRAEASGLESSTRPGVPASVKWTVSFQGKDGPTTYRIWEQEARKKADLRQLAARLGTLVRTHTKQQPVGFPREEKLP